MTLPDADRRSPEPMPSASPEALSEQALARQFWERIRLFATRRLGSVSAAEDVAQETLRRVTEALRAGRVRQLEALPAFVFQTALHVCLHHNRSSEREARALDRLATVEPEPEAPDPLAALISDERRAVVQRGLARLRRDDRELLHLMYFQGLEPEELARRWDITPGALRVRKHRALQRLAQFVDGNDG